MDHPAKLLCGRALCLLVLLAVCAGCAPPQPRDHHAADVRTITEGEVLWVRHLEHSRRRENCGPLRGGRRRSAKWSSSTFPTSRWALHSAMRRCTVLQAHAAEIST